MEKCKSCSHPFTWKELYKSFIFGYKPIECSNCGSVNIINIPSRLLLGFLTIMPMLVYGLYFSIYHSITYLAVALIISFFISLSFPFIAKYKLYLED